MKILVTLDGSEFSEAILAPVSQAVRAFGAQVQLLSVVRPDRARQTPAKYDSRDPIPAGGPDGTSLGVPLLHQVIAPPAETREQALERVEDTLKLYLRTQAQKLGAFDVTVSVDFADDPAQAIIAHARRERVDLIAMATHGHRLVGDIVYGSVANTVRHRASVPVLLVRGARANRAERGA